MDRVILHIDLNSFYASVDMLYNPSLRDVPMATAGLQSERRGIILSKNLLAKQAGIQTGEAIVSAKRKCPNLVCVPPDYKLYIYYSKKVKDIYHDYTDKIESFGIDEAWLDITSSIKLFGNPIKIANMIKERIKFELGLTVSIGISFNKIYAKLGSDLAKNDSIFTIFKDEIYKIHSLPASSLIYVGSSTYKKLKLFDIYTIEDIIKKDISFMKKHFGKMGEIIWIFASGYDISEVNHINNNTLIKSVGNSTTTVKDIKTYDEFKIVLTILSESVAHRLREQGFYGKTISLYIRYNDLKSFTKQCTLNTPTDLSSTLIEKGMDLCKKIWDINKPLRSLGISVSSLSTNINHQQISLFYKEEYDITQKKLEIAIDEIRNRFGNSSIKRGISQSDLSLSGFNPKEDHTIHPVSYFR